MDDPASDTSPIGSDEPDAARADESRRLFGETVAQIRAFQRGDPQALEDLFARYYPVVKRIVCSRMGRMVDGFVDVEDIAQEALLRAFRGLPKFEHRSEGTFRSWLACLVQARLVDSRRRGHAEKRGRGQVQSLTDAFPEESSKAGPVGSEPTPSGCVQVRELARAREAALLELSGFHRELINLRENCGMTHAEIAAELGLGTDCTSRMAYHRASGKLREILRRRGFDARG